MNSEEPAAVTTSESEDPLGVAIVTISATRTIETDEPGTAIATAFEDDGHEITTRELIEPGFDNVQSNLSRLVGRGDVDVVVTTGSTGVSPEAITLEAVTPLIQKELPAFSDLFTNLAYDETGTGVLCTRALAGVIDGVPVFCLPDDVAASQLATREIIVPEIPGLTARTAPPTETSD